MVCAGAVHEGGHGAPARTVDKRQVPGGKCHSTVTLTRALGRNRGGLVVGARLLSFSGTWSIQVLLIPELPRELPRKSGNPARLGCFWEAGSQPAKPLACLPGPLRCPRLGCVPAHPLPAPPSEPALPATYLKPQSAPCGLQLCAIIFLGNPELNPAD